jgi:hydrogenase expression/formation protein HypC
MCLAIPGRIVAIAEGEGFDRRGTVDHDGVRQEVALAYLPEAQVGDYVLVHVGFAMTRLDTEEAERILREIRELGIGG